MKSEGNMQFRLINDKDGLKVNLKWTTNTEDYSIPPGSTLIFLDDKGNKHELTSVAEVFPRSGGGATGGFFGANILGLDITYTGDLSFLGSGLVTDMRINNNRSAVDVSVSEKNAEKIAKLYQLVQDKLK